MAAKTYWYRDTAEKYYVILNQPGTRYTEEIWERLRNSQGITDQELANQLNNQ